MPNSAMQQRIDAAIELTQRRYLSTEQHTPWDVVHGIKAFGQRLELKDGGNGQNGSTGEFVNAIDFLCHDAKVGGRRIFQPTANGLKPIRGWGMEGHPDQFLSALAQAGVRLDHPIEVDGQRYTVGHLLEQAKYDYHAGQEATWTLIAFSTCLSPDETWSNMHGDVFSIEDLVEHEVQVEPTRAACGGTHNLYALAYALNRHQEAGGSTSGVWEQAARKLDRYHQLTRTLQNPDGSCSPNYYEGRGDSGDPSVQMGTTGHTLEWLTLYLSDEQLNEEWFTRAVKALLTTFEKTSTQPVDCGALYHAARALVQFERRMFPDSMPLAVGDDAESSLSAR